MDLIGSLKSCPLWSNSVAFRRNLREARGILHDGSDPDGRKAERLDVVELVDDTGKVTAHHLIRMMRCIIERESGFHKQDSPVGLTITADNSQPNFNLFICN